MAHCCAAPAPLPELSQHQIEYRPLPDSVKVTVAPREDTCRGRTELQNNLQ